VSAVSPAAPSALAADLYERHGGRVLRFCLGRLSSREDAEDATQTTFLNAVGALRRGTVPHAEVAWLLRIAENVCHHRHRTAARRKESACDPTVLADVVEAPPARPDELIHLAAALESLPARQRRAVLLREWQGLSYHEIGTELGLSHSAVETLLFRARRGLAQALEQDGRPRRQLGIVSLLGWLKSAVGSLAGVKVAAAVVAVTITAVPTRDRPAPQPTPDAPASSHAAVLTPAAPVPARPAADRRPAAAPARPTARTAPAPSTRARGGRPAAVETEPPALASPAPAPKAADPAPPAAIPPTSEPRRDAPPPPVDPPVQLPPVQLPPVEVPPLPVPIPALPDVTGAVPALPELPKLPELPVPQLPVPGLP
jgi:RNA polymerase sigma factor (sigma-70 family)